MLALGVAPVGVREWFGEQPFATWPWAQDALGDAEPEVLPPTELNFERIAGLRPDLIVGVSSGMTEDEYGTLSEIAPTLAQAGEYVDFGVPWQEQTRVIGRALGREGRAEELVAEVEGGFDRAREEHPEFEGASGVVVGLSTEGNSYTPSPYGPQDVRGHFLTSLGFEIPREVSELAGDSFFANLSRERLGLIDTDVLIWVPVLAEGFDAVQKIRSTASSTPRARAATCFWRRRSPGANLATAAGFWRTLGETVRLLSTRPPDGLQAASILALSSSKPARP